MKRILAALLLTCLAAAAWGCSGEPDATPTPEPTPEPTSGAIAQTSQQAEQPTQGSPSTGQGQQSSSSSSDDDDEDKDSEDDDNGDSGERRSNKHDDDSKKDDDATVSNVNPGLVGTYFDSSRNDALSGAEPLDAVAWSVKPTISTGALDAAGELTGGAMLFNPMVDGEGAGFIVYYKDLSEPLALLLPDLGPMDVWDSQHTIAPMEHEFEGSSFTIRAYSPLFMDVGPGDLVIRVFGTDGNGKDALLAVEPVGLE